MREATGYRVELMRHFDEEQGGAFPPEPAQEEVFVMRLRLMVAAAAGLALLGTGVAQAAGPYPPPSKGTGRVDPSHIKAGECAVFSGDGFAPLSPVAVSDNGVSRGSTTASSSGTFSIQLCYPTNASKGRHNLAGSGTGADGNPLTVYAVLIVEGVRQSASNPATQTGGQAASGDSTGGSPVIGGTSGAVALPADGGSSPAAPVGSESSGTRLLALGLSAVGFAFLASLLLLLLARRRRRRDDDGSSFDPSLLPA